MKNQKKIAVILLLLFMIGISGCKKSTPPPKELDWAIAGVRGYETDEAISKDKIEALNQVLVEKGKDYQIKFHFVAFQNGKLTEEDEKILRKCDLVTIENQLTITDEVKFYPTLLECEKKNLFEPLDKYLNTEKGKKIKERMLSDLTLQPGAWENKQWLLPTSLLTIEGASLRINKKLYEKSGLRLEAIPDFTRCDELFEKLYVANGKEPFLVLSDRKTMHGINGIPGELPYYLSDLLNCCGGIWISEALGVGVPNSAGNDLDTINLLQETYFEEYLNAWKRYIDQGYVESNMNGKALVKLQDSYIPRQGMGSEEEEWIIPKSENYRLILINQPKTLDTFNGIIAESKQKELAFEALTDMILDRELNEIIQNLGVESISEFVFQTGLSEEEENEYKQLVKTIPQFVLEYNFDTFSVPEIAEINKVYAEYSTEEEDDGTQKVLERHFSKDGKVTEESIHEGIQRLNEKLDAAGMEKFIEALKEQKLKSKR